MTQQNENENAWKSFEQSGKIADYLKYSEYKKDVISKVGTDAAKDAGNYSKTTQYR